MDEQYDKLSLVERKAFSLKVQKKMCFVCCYRIKIFFLKPYGNNVCPYEHNSKLLLSSDRTVTTENDQNQRYRRS